MRLVRLIYVSRMTERCDIEAMQQILAVSRLKNKEKDITGILCYDPSYFLQCLEGPRDAVNELYSGILRDPRHENVVLLEYCEPGERQFPEWSMAFLSTADMNPGMLKKYAGVEKFDPYELGSKDACNFLVHITEQARDYLR